MRTKNYANVLYRFWFLNIAPGPKSYQDFRETGSRTEDQGNRHFLRAILYHLKPRGLNKKKWLVNVFITFLFVLGSLLNRDFLQYLLVTHFENIVNCDKSLTALCCDGEVVLIVLSN